MKIDYLLDNRERKEDGYLIKEPVLAVFDGANSTNRFFTKEGVSGGQLAMQIAQDVFAQNDRDLWALAREANQKIRQRMESEDIDPNDKLNLWLTAFAAVRMGDASFDWLQISDCQIILIYQDGTFKLLAEGYDHDQETLLEWQKFAQQKIKNIREHMDAAAMQNVRRQINLQWGALTGEPEYVNFLQGGQEDLKNVQHLILTTDGLFLPKEDPKAEDDFTTFVKLYLEGGLKNIQAHVRELQDQDPHCWQYPRYKQYDDIAAISITF